MHKNEEERSQVHLKTAKKEIPPAVEKEMERELLSGASCINEEVTLSWCERQAVTGGKLSAEKRNVYQITGRVRHEDIPEINNPKIIFIRFQMKT